jgi:hypothetical protein
MKKLIVIAMAMMIFATSAAGVSADSGLAYKTTKASKGYVTKFYNGSKCVGKVRTTKKLKVKVVNEKKVTAKTLNNRRGRYILVEKMSGKCISKKGDGRTTVGHYIRYKNADKGDKFTTYAVYGDSRYIDDISIRVDIER